MIKDPILSSVLDFAKKDDNIRAVVLNGSRVNPNVKKDHYQDYDIAFFVRSIDQAYKNARFLDHLGDIVIRQTHEDMTFDPPNDYFPIIMTQYKSGLRIDLSFEKNEYLLGSLKNDSLSELLLDKDNIVTHKIKPNESSYHVKKPTHSIFLSCINEFLWVMPYIKKGLNRHHYVYAIEHVNILRTCLEAMIGWSIGIKHDFLVSTGKAKMNYPTYLDETTFKKYLSTFPKADNTDILNAVDTLYDLFKHYTNIVSKAFKFNYNQREFEQVKSFFNTY